MRPVPPGTGKKILFGGAAVLLCFGLLEGVFALAGVKPQLYAQDPYVGFSSSTPLFVAENDPSGEAYLVTAANRLDFFNRQRFPKAKPAGTCRIFSMGGSTTYGHPYSDPTSFSGWLREYLRATSPEKPTEVINAGGISYGSYRVAQLMEELVKDQPDLFLIYCGQNEFLERRIYGQVERVPRAIRGLAGLAWHLRTATVLDRLLQPVRAIRRDEAAARTVLENDPVTMLDGSLGPTAYTRDDQQREQIFRHFEFNVRRMVDIARSAGAQVIFVTPASNLREVSPFKSEHREGLGPEDRARWKALYDQARQDFASAVPGNALPALAAAEAIDNRPANLHYVRGRVLEKLGRYPEARAAYERARDEDVCPLRAPTQIREVLSRVTADLKVPLVDFESLIASRSTHGIPGGDYFLDHVHLTVEGYRLLALELLKQMERNGLVHPNWDSALLDRTTSSVLSRIDSKVNGVALMNLCKTLGWAGKREEAYRAGLRAVELAGDIADVQYQAGLAAQLSSRTNEAQAFYRRAIALQPAFGEAHCALGVVLEDTGQWPQALDQFQLAAHYGKPNTVQRDQQNLARIRKKVAETPGRHP
ncbi:MAG: tetratricopeptide repeat protein [Verrucomicrobiota bacterium]